MSDVVLSAGVRQNLLALQTTANLMGITQNRLATGKKVNSALDNPVNFFTSSGLRSRANDLSALLDAMSNGIKTIEAANNGITAINQVIESMKSTLIQARQDKSFQSASNAIDTTAIGTNTLKNLSFSGGAVGTTPVDVALNTTSTIPAVQASVTTANSSYTAPTAATQSTVTAANNYNDIDLSNDANDSLSFDVTLGATTKTITLTRAGAGADNVYSIGEAVTEIQNQLNAGAPLGVTVGTDLSGTKLLFKANTAGANTLTISNASIVDGAGGGANQAVTDLGITNAATTGQQDTGANAVNRSITINGVNITLTAANAATATTAAATINTALSSAGANVTAIGDNANGKIDLLGAADGSTSITIGGADAIPVFGTPGSRTTVTGSLASPDGAVKTVDQLVNDINTNTALTGKVQASNDNGKLRLFNLSTSALTIAGITGGITIDGGTGTSTIGGNDVRTQLVKQFNDLRDQLDKLADDSSFNGVNLLRGDKLKVTLNETGTSTIEIQAKDVNGTVRPIDSIHLNIQLLQNSDVDSDTNIDSLLGNLANALGTVRAQASDFGSNLSVVQYRTDFTKSMINTLQVGADNLVLADSNEEGANMLALQTRQQLSVTALSLASQADQAVLRLFG